MDTEKDFVKSADSHFIGCLLLHQYRQDQALGITWYSRRVRSLLWYYLYLRRKEETGFLQMAYLNGIIQEGSKQIKRLVAEAETADSEGKHKLLRQAQIMQTAMSKAKEQYDLLIADTNSPVATTDV